MRRTVLCLATVFVLGAGRCLQAEEPAAPAADLTNEACLGCHDDAEFATEDGRSLYVGSALYDASMHGGVDCTSCHVDATDDPHDKLGKVNLDTCASCHDEAVPKYRHGVHGKANAQGVAEAATCADCHGNLHADKTNVETDSPMHWSHQAETCARCHGDTALAEKFGIPVVRPVDAYLKSAHARAVAAGKHGASCADCHGSHEVLPSRDPESSVWRTHVPDMCGTCHEEITLQFKDSVHGTALEKGNRDVPVCTDCHGEHRILGVSEPSSPVFASNIPGDTCGRCHADERMVEKYDLSVGSVSAFQDSFHGLALRSGRLSVANCASCHGVHDIRPSSDPRSSVSSANLAATCGKCHPGAGQTFALGPVHKTADTFGAWLVGWIRFVYLWLIAVVIGGMVAHNALDWLRKARHPEPPAPPVPADQRERMPRAMRWQHATMMISFPILVYTGFALTYPEAWWSAPLLKWESRIGLRGLIHRAAAVVMVVGFVWHVIYVITNPWARACMRGLFPTVRDVRIFFSTLAWYLGRRSERPRSGRFNYAEKAEYWAFLWGTAVMTVTGLLLWFANLTLRYLPSWVADVATALHFYEAILAALAILVWHFYWVIFDPDVYPMDWTWLTGKPPASREHERQPEE